MDDDEKDPKDLTLDEIKEVLFDSEAVSESLQDGQEPLDMEELQRKVESGEVKIQWAPQLHIEDLGDWVDKVLDAMGYGSAIVSDMSRVSDFPMDPISLGSMRQELGIEVDGKEYIYQVAQRLKDSKE